jgi:hypothetical protein
MDRSELAQESRALKQDSWDSVKKTVAKSVIAPAAQAANEAATGGVPPYFFKLVNKIKSLGDDATPKYANQPRETVTRYKDYQLTEHLDTGRTTVRRFKQSEADYS